MINIQLTELDLSLEVAEISDLGVILDEHSTVGLQGPLVFGVNATPIEFGYLDLDLIGFPYHGLSAYELAVQNGFVGSLAEWLESLRGEPGGLSPEGTNAVIRAETAATSASGSATAAAGYRTEAFTYSGYAGVHAQSASEAYTQAVAMRDETGQIAQAFTSIYQQSEAMLIGTTEIANATIQQRVLAETARAEAYGARDLAVNAVTTATSASVTATEQATLAVEARNEAADEAAAAVISSSEASSFADDARVEAAASQESRIVASAARDEAQITAAAVIIDRDIVSGYVDDASAEATASRDQRILAEAARDLADGYAAASLTHSETAEARSNDAGDYAAASDAQRILAQTAAGEAAIERAAAASSASDANGFRVAAQTAEGLAAGHRTAAGLSATAAADIKAEVEVLADAAGVIQSALSGRVSLTETNIGDLNASTAITQSSVTDIVNGLNEASIRLVTAASGGDPAIVELFSDGVGGATIKLLAAQIFFGANTFFEDYRDTFVTRSGSVRFVRAQGAPFGTDSLTYWHGLDSVTLGTETKANAISWEDSTGNGFYGGTTLSGPFDSALTAASVTLSKVAWTDVAVIPSLVTNNGYFLTWPALSFSGGGTIVNPSDPVGEHIAILTIEWQIISTNQAGTDAETLQSGTVSKSTIGGSTGVSGGVLSVTRGAFSSVAGTKAGERRIVLQAMIGTNGTSGAATNRRLSGFYAS